MVWPSAPASRPATSSSWTPADLVAFGPAQKWLVDPPREGAFALAKAVADLHAEPLPGWQPPQRIVYVSCNPATLARDAGLLVNVGGYRCARRGGEHVPAHGPRGEHGRVRAGLNGLSAGAAREIQKERGSAEPLSCLRAASGARAAQCYSLSPPKMPSRASRLWNTL